MKKRLILIFTLLLILLTGITPTYAYTSPDTISGAPDPFGDQTAPVIDGGVAILYVNVDSPVTVTYVLSTLSATDETDGDITDNIYILSDAYTGNQGTLGDYDVVFEVSDAAGNLASTTITFRVVDVTIPVITLTAGSTMYIEYGSTYSEPGASCTDNYDASCSVVITGTVNNSVLGTYYKYYNATDSSSNPANQVTRTVIVRDTTPATITLNGSSTVYVEYGSTYTELGASAVDTYDGTHAATVSGTVNNSVLGTYTITYSYTDSNGNVSTPKTRTVIVRDTTAAIISLNGSSTIYIEYGDSYTELGASAVDNYDGTVAATITGTVNVSTLGTYTITYSYTDSSGNISTSVTRTVIVRDTEAAAITLNGSSTIYVEYGSTYTELGASAVDNYDGTDTAAISGSVNVNVLGTYTITYNYTDSSGNISTSVTRTVIVRDTTPAVITLAAGSTMYVEFGSNYNDAGATWTDLYDGSGSATATGTVNVGVLGTYTITYSYTDSSGNASTPVIRTVIVRDTVAPTITASSIYNYNLTDNVTLAEIVALITASDLYDGDVTDSATVFNDNFNNQGNVVGSYTFMIQFSDSSGNTATQTITVNILDNQRPTFSSTLTLFTVEEANAMTQEQIRALFGH